MARFLIRRLAFALVLLLCTSSAALFLTRLAPGDVTSQLGPFAPRAEIDAFKLWLAFIDHGDTKTDNHKFACLDSKKNPDNTRACKPGEAVYYVGDMGSTWGFSKSSENKAKLEVWRKKNPISFTAPSIC